MTSLIVLLSSLASISLVLGGVVSAIWLIIIGKWQALLYAILLSMVSSFLISLVMMPGALFAVPAMKSMEKGNRILGYFFMLCSNFYTYAVLFFWEMKVLDMFIPYIGRGDKGLVPILILAYCVTISPVSYLASKERDNIFTMITTMCFSIGSFIFYVGLIFGMEPNYALLLLFGTLLIGLFVTLITVIEAYTLEHQSDDGFR